MDILINKYENILWKNENKLSGPIDSDCKVPLVRKIHLTQLSGELPIKAKTDENEDDSISINLIPFAKLERFLAKELVIAKTNLIKVPFLETTYVFLAKYFNDI